MEKKKFQFDWTVFGSVCLDVLSSWIVFFLCVVATFTIGEASPLSSYDWMVLTFYGLAFSGLIVFVLMVFQNYRMILINFGVGEAVKTSAIVFLTSIIAFAIMYCFPETMVPRFRLSSCFMGAITLVFFCVGARAARRLIDSVRKARARNNLPLKRTLVVGAGAAGKIVIDDSRTNLESKNRVVVVVDDDKQKIHKTFAGIPVEGPISNIAAIVKKYEIDEVIIAIQSLSKDHLAEIIGYLRESDVRIRRLPVLAELGTVNNSQILNVDIGEILGREPVVLNNGEISGMLNGKTVLVTGAGGSIGSELVRQIYKTHPANLVLFDIYENGVYAIQQEIRREIARENCQDVNLVTLIGSTYNEVRIEQVIRQYRPDYIYHAAAYKHVPLMEESPVEAVRTNVIGTYNVARLADKYGVKKMLLVSTDKAVRPTNAMGATKRFAEMIIQYFAKQSKVTKYCAVRFGNVLGSNGSVIPLFEKQISEGGPVTVTDPNIIRYFMTIPEAVGLILQSSIYAEKGEIFILDMGKPVRIITVAEKMIRQAGFIPYKEMPIVITGLRPGEKLYEETLLNPAKQEKTANNKIYIEERGAVEPIEEDIKNVSAAFGIDATPNDVKGLIQQVVKTYKPEMDD
jgi:FlaA1/EpsC-like NDP-sugar epimerase